jgi:hypothetical protein
MFIEAYEISHIISTNIHFQLVISNQRLLAYHHCLIPLSYEACGMFMHVHVLVRVRVHVHVRACLYPRLCPWSWDFLCYMK